MKCIICKSKQVVFKLGKTPISGYKCVNREESLNQPLFNLNLNFCPICKMVNYSNQEGINEILDKLYSQHLGTYYSTPYLNTYLNNFVNKLIVKYQLTNKSKILEIGCNNGRLLMNFKQKLNCSTIGVEPSTNFKNEWNDNNIEVINDYYSAHIAKELLLFKPDLIVLRHVLEHIPDLLEFFKNVAEICTNKTTIIIEVPYFKTVLSNKRIDNVSYSHLNYFSVSPMLELTKKFNMEITETELVDTDGGSIIFHITKNSYGNTVQTDIIDSKEIKEFIDSIQIVKSNINEHFKNYRKESIVGYGAGAKGQHLLHILGLEKIIGSVVDDTSEFQGMFIPGTDIKIEDPKILLSGKTKAVINLVPTHIETIRSKIPEGIEFYDIFEYI